MDYTKLGLRVGLEIHQQLATKTKLFCRCPVMRSEELPISLRRKLRSVASELGDIDPAAQYEYIRDRNFVYRANPESSCLVESDEDPPKDLNMEALHTAIQVCKLLDCEIVDELHVMRKTVIDGSSVSGFQRTVLVGTNGSIDTSMGKVGIGTVCLEEDSATKISEKGNTIEYRLDRLGIPLIEIATDSSIKTPEHAHEVAEKLGLILRSLNVVRGIGSIRQDVNISIRGGARVEIKGFQELGKIANLVENEAQRQAALLRVKEELHKRGVKDIKEQAKDVTDIFKETKNNMLRKFIEDDRKIYAAKLSGFSGILKESLGAHTLGRELSFYAEAYGGGIIHSDEDVNKHNISNEFITLRKRLPVGERDIIFICAGPEKSAIAVIDRAKYCLIGVPEETRASIDSGSRFIRPLPGSGRMYPETDVKPLRITSEMRKVILPKTLVEAKEELSKKLPSDLADQMVKSRLYPYYQATRENHPEIDPVFVANVFLSILKDLKRSGHDVDKISKDDVGILFSMIEKNEIPKSSMREALIMLTEGKDINTVKKSMSSMTEEEVRKIISDAIKRNSGKNESVLMGIIMSKTGGRADGAHVARLLREMM